MSKINPYVVLLTLIATPVAYSLLDDLRSTARWRRWASSAHKLTEPVRARIPRVKSQPAEAQLSEHEPDHGPDTLTTRPVGGGK